MQLERARHSDPENRRGNAAGAGSDESHAKIGNAISIDVSCTGQAGETELSSG